MNKVFTILLLIVFSTSLLAQKPNKEFKKVFLEAYGAMQYGGFSQALNSLKKIEEMGLANANVNYNIGLCYLNMEGDKGRAIPYLGKAVGDISMDYRDGSYKETKSPPEAIFYLAKAYRIDMQLDKAIEFYQKYKETLPANDVYFHDFVDLQIQTCNNAKEYIEKPVQVKITNLGPTINDADDNFNPVITPDGNTMMYTTLQRIFDRVSQQETFFEIINYVTKENGNWTAPLDITSKINSDGYAASVGISSDGTEMFFFRDDYGDGNLYLAKKMGYRFNDLEKLGKEINSREWESHASISSDGNTLYFVSTRGGGLGGRDIYKSTKNEKGEWDNVENLGESINTPYEEDCPVISEDGNTLYFCSEAHSSMGGYDIFYSKKDGSGNWSTPLNLGYPINSTDDDLFFHPYQNGKYALFSKSNPDDTYGRKDIYRYQLKFEEGEEVDSEPEVTVAEVETTPDVTETEIADETITTETETQSQVIPVETEEEPVVQETETQEQQPTQQTVYLDETEEQPAETEPDDGRTNTYIIRGIILLADNKQVTSEFKVLVKNVLTGNIQGEVTPDAEGKFLVPAPPGNYAITFSGPGYESVLRTASIPRDYSLPFITIDIEMSPAQVASGNYVVKRGVLFNKNSSDLTRDAKVALERLYTLMTQNPTFYIQVTGHASPSEDDGTNKRLSQKRARSVIDYLVERGVERSRFVSKAAGQTAPLADASNTNPEAQKYNRRVEVNITNPGNARIRYEEFRVPGALRVGTKGLKLQYTVFLTDSPKPLALDYFKKVEAQGISNVWLFQSETGYLYTIGKYASKSKASELLNKAVDMGFPNARIINYKELERRKFRGQLAARKKLRAQNQVNGKYTIQLHALEVPVDTDYYKDLEGVKKIKFTDSLYRYIWGRFDHETAKKKQKQLIEMGYTDAFVMEIEFYE